MVSKKIKKVVVTLANEHYLDQIKALFSSIYFNSGWDGDYMLLAHDIPDEKLDWFREKGILIKKCDPFYYEQVGINGVLVLSKLYIFSPEFKKWDKIIFLDGDILVRGSMDSLLNVETLGAVPIINIYRNNFLGQFYKYDAKRLGDLKSKFDVEKPALNSGMLAFDTKIIKNNMLKDFRKIIDEYKDIICISEETVLNIYFYNKWKELSAVYNVCPNWEHAFRGCSPEDLKGIILHTYSCFVPEYRKFWESASPFFKEWNYNLSKSDLIDIKKPLKAKKKYTKKQEEEYGREIHNLMKNYPNVIEDMKKRVKIVEKKNKAQEKKSKMIRRKEKVSSFFRNLRSKIKGKR